MACKGGEGNFNLCWHIILSLWVFENLQVLPKALKTLRRISTYSRVQKSIENWSVWSKMALGEVGVPLP